jgi:hypothetical protein
MITVHDTRDLAEVARFEHAEILIAGGLLQIYRSALNHVVGAFPADRFCAIDDAKLPTKNESPAAPK